MSQGLTKSNFVIWKYKNPTKVYFLNYSSLFNNKLNLSTLYNMSNNNQPNRNYYQQNPNYQPLRSYAPPQPNNQSHQPNDRVPSTNQYYNPNQRNAYPNPAPYPGNYYYPYPPYGNYNSYPPQQFGPPPMYMQQPIYPQQMPQNMHHMGYNRPMPQYPQKQNQFSSQSNPNQSKKNDEISQGSNSKNYQVTPNKRQSTYNDKFDSQYPRQTQRQSHFNKTPQKKSANYNEDEQDPQIDINQYQSNSESEDEQEQIFYRKKAIAKKKDPVLDSREQIRKWVQARRRNYPRRNITPAEKEKKVEQDQLSLLQKKIRKKICLINSDPKSILKKQKDLDILRRFMLYPRRPRKQQKFVYEKKQQGPFVQEIVQNVNEKQKEPEIQIPIQKQLKEYEEIVQKIQTIKQPEEDEVQQALQLPIKSNVSIVPIEKEQRTYEGGRNRRQDLSVDVIIKHLQMKQREDTKALSNLMDYKTNSFNYRYQYQTLQTNLMLQNIFKDTSYMLQAIRYIVKNNFFD